MWLCVFIVDDNIIQLLIGFALEFSRKFFSVKQGMNSRTRPGSPKAEFATLLTTTWAIIMYFHQCTMLKRAVALYKVFEFVNCEIRNVLIMRIGHRSKMQEYAR
jgi:hypothetical protein